MVTMMATMMMLPPMVIVPCGGVGGLQTNRGATD
jgi:hypothetical protein